MKYKNIALVNTKGGAGKSTISFHLLPYFLKEKDFEVIEIDDNNVTATTFAASYLLDGRVKSVSVEQGTEELERIVVENMIDAEKMTIIDAGGGNDTRAVIKMIKDSAALKDETLFIIPYFPDFAQLDNVQQTVEMLQGCNYIVVLNNTNLRQDDEMFAIGSEDYEIPSMEKLYKGKFYRVPKTTLFSFTAARGKETIGDAAGLYNMMPDEAEFLREAKEKTEGDATEMLTRYREWKRSKICATVLQHETIMALKKAVTE
jgi:hypothetical protein